MKIINDETHFSISKSMDPHANTLRLINYRHSVKASFVPVAEDSVQRFFHPNDQQIQVCNLFSFNRQTHIFTNLDSVILILFETNCQEMNFKRRVYNFFFPFLSCNRRFQPTCIQLSNLCLTGVGHNPCHYSYKGPLFPTLSQSILHSSLKVTF